MTPRKEGRKDVKDVKDVKEGRMSRKEGCPGWKEEFQGGKREYA
jgi:hypothetical protein